MKKKKHTGWIVVLLIILLLISAIFDRVNINRNPAITENEWISILQNGFGVDIDNVECSDEPATGAYIAKSIYSALGDELIEELLGRKFNTQEEQIDAITQLGIVSRAQLKSGFTATAAQKTINRAVKTYFDNPVAEYCNIKYKDGIVVNDNIQVVSEASNNRELVVKSSDPIHENEIILVKNELGIATSKKVESVSSTDSGEYRVTTSDVTDIKDVAETIEFSGFGDFSGYKNLGTADDTEGDASVGGIKESMADIYDTVTHPVMTVYAAEPDDYLGGDDWTDKTFGKSLNESTEKADIKISIARTENEQDEKGMRGSVKINGVTVVGETKDDPEHVKQKVSTDHGFAGSVELKNLVVTAKGFVDLSNLGDEDNFIEVNATSDVIFDLTFNGSISGEFPIVKDGFWVPITATGGTVSVKIIPYLVVGLDGELSIKYEIYDATVGVSLSTAEGLRVPHTNGGTKFDVTGKVSIHAGAKFKATVIAFGTFDLIDPTVTAEAVATAKILDEKKGYEEYPNCIELSVSAPKVDLAVVAGTDTVCYKLIDFLGLKAKLKWTLIKEEDAPFRKTLHIETDLNNKTSIVDECTHVEKEDLDEDLGEKAKDLIDDKIEKEKQKLSEEIEQAIEDMLEDMLEAILEETCQGCY